MSERVTGQTVTGRVVRWAYVDRITGRLVYESDVDAAPPGAYSAVALVEVDERVNDMAAIGGALPAEETDDEFIDQIMAASSAPWPPTWGEGPTSGWCRRKSDGLSAWWKWLRPNCIVVEAGMGAMFRSPDEFAAEFEPV